MVPEKTEVFGNTDCLIDSRLEVTSPERINDQRHRLVSCRFLCVLTHTQTHTHRPHVCVGMCVSERVHMRSRSAGHERYLIDPVYYLTAGTTYRQTY